MLFYSSNLIIIYFFNEILNLLLKIFGWEFGWGGTSVKK